MPTVQISKIILSVGESNELPGAPTLLSPLTFSEPLDTGEMAYITDLGRVYIGPPESGYSQHNRATFPYQNIEVLTENSSDTIGKILADIVKNGESEFFFNATLSTLNTWSPVITPLPNSPSHIFSIPYSEYVAANIEYAVFNEDLSPVKIGTLSLSYTAGESEPRLCDDSTSIRRLDVFSPDHMDPESLYNYVDFRFVVDGPINSRFLKFEYKKSIQDVIQLRFKVTRMKV